jgi:hypothetical protein
MKRARALLSNIKLENENNDIENNEPPPHLSKHKKTDDNSESSGSAICSSEQVRFNVIKNHFLMFHEPYFTFKPLANRIKRAAQRCCKEKSRSGMFLCYTSQLKQI